MQRAALSLASQFPPSSTERSDENRLSRAAWERQDGGAALKLSHNFCSTIYASIWLRVMLPIASLNILKTNNGFNVKLSESKKVFVFNNF